MVIKMKKFTRIIAGAVLIACGVVYLLDVFGIADVNFSFDGWWTVFIIVPCFCGLFTNRDKSGSFIGLLVGVLLLLAARGIILYDMVWKAILPVIIIMFGIKMILKSTVLQKEKKDAGTAEEAKQYMTAFNSQTVDFSDDELTVAKIGSVFGGTRCNMTNAKIKDGSRLDVMCVFGGADIFVPEEVNVKINTFCLFGGVSDKRDGKYANKEGKTLNINGFCIFGGVDIK